MVRIDSDKCTGCGVCVGTCPQHAITIDNSLAVINQELCTQCMACAEICPEGAIHILVPAYTESRMGGDNMVYGYGRGFGRRGGAGFGFRGIPAPWPYIGRGRGGLPRCWHHGLWGGAASYIVPGVVPYWLAPMPEERLGFFKDQADLMKHQLEDIERRIQELEKNE